MIALDTNVLVYAHRRDNPFHAAAIRQVAELAEGRNAWAIPWACLHEFYAVVTSRRANESATTPAQALEQIDAWRESGSLRVLTETATHHVTLAALLREAHCVGPMVYDARIAAICLDHGVSELITMDRDFARFPALRTRSLLA